MRGVVLSLLLSGVALADIGPPAKESCDAPAARRACMLVPRADGGGSEEADAGCIASADDAGLELFACIQVSDGGTNTYFYCPPGSTPEPKSGCSVAGVPLALLAVLGAWRTRRR